MDWHFALFRETALALQESRPVLRRLLNVFGVSAVPTVIAEAQRHPVVCLVIQAAEPG